MKEVEYAFKEDGSKETGAIVVDNIEDSEHLEDIIRNHDRFLEKEGGRPNRKEMLADELESYIEDGDKEMAQMVLQKHNLSNTSKRRALDILEDRGVETEFLEINEG